MAGESQPSAPRLSKQVVPAGIVVRAPSLRTAVIVFIAVLILFRWLHLILALQITSTGRQIQTRTEELRRHERVIADLQRRIAIAESPNDLADVAEEMGYGPRTAVYVPLDQALVPLTQGSSAGPISAPADQTQPRSEAGLFGGWGAALGTWAESGSAP